MGECLVPKCVVLGGPEESMAGILAKRVTNQLMSLNKMDIPVFDNRPLFYLNRHLSIFIQSFYITLRTF